MDLSCTERYFEESEDEDSTKSLRKALCTYNSDDSTSFLLDLGPKLLLWASGYGQPRIVELLIECGVDVNYTNNYGDTSLQQSIEKNHFLVARALLRANASVTTHIDEFHSPLHYAAILGYVKIIESLFAAGAVLNAQDTQGCTPLHAAVYWDRCKAIEVLLSRGADPDIQDLEGRTALFSVKSKGAVILLLNAGAQLEAKDNKQRTSLQEAVEQNRLEPVIALLNAGANPNVGRESLDPPDIVNNIPETSQWERVRIHEVVQQVLPPAVRSYFAGKMHN